jgi:small-conductance mechanosensitive channel
MFRIFRSRPKRLRGAWAATVLACLVAISLALQVFAAEAPDLLTLRTMLQKISQGLDIRAEELNATQQAMPALLETLRTEVSRSGNRFYQVQLLRNVSGDTPWAVRTILVLFQDLHEDLSLKAQPLMQLQEQLVRSRGDDATFLGLQADIAAAAPDSAELEDIESTLIRLKAIRADEDTVLRNVDLGLMDANRLLERIRLAQEQGRQRVISVLADYYFESNVSVLTASGRNTARGDLRTWANDFPQFFKSVGHWMRWGEAFEYAAPGFLLVYWAIPLLWRRSRRGNAGSLWRMGPGWFLFSLGLAASVAFRLALFTMNQFTSLGAVAVLTLGLVLVLEGEQRGTAQGFRFWRGSTLLALWALYAAGALALALDIPVSVMGPYANISCALTAVWLLVVKSPGVTQRQSATRMVSAAILAALAIVAPFGVGPQSLTVSQTLFMLLLVMKSMEAIKRRLYGAAVGTDDPEEPSKVSVMAYPLVAAVLAFLYVLWVFMFIGGPGFLGYMLSRKWTVGSMSLSIESLGLILILFFALRLSLAWITLVTAHARFKGGKLNSAMAHTVNATVSYFAWTLFALVSVHLLGMSLSSLTWIVSGLSVGVGFGLKDIVNNFISGLIILFGGAIKKGDVIQQGKNLGEVIDVSVRNTTIRTPDNTMVIIPNSTFLRGEIINLSYQDAKTRLTIPVTVVPGTKVNKVIKILLKVAKDNDNVLKTPPPDASLVRFGKLGLEFELYVWIENFLMKFDTEAQLVTEIDKRFHNNKVTLAFQGVKVKYKPRGDEQQQLDSQREMLRNKRKEVFARVRSLRNVHARLRWNVASVTKSGPGE